MVEIGLTPSQRPAIPAGIDLDTIIRSGLFLAVVLVVWVSFHPFQDLSVRPQELTDGGNFANQVGFASLFLILAAWTFFHGVDRLRPLLRPAFIAMLLWFALCVATSWEPALSARRLAFTLIVMGLAGMTLLLPKNLRHFTDLVAAAAFIVLTLCYAGVLLAPDLAIHQSTDFLEPELQLARERQPAERIAEIRHPDLATHLPQQLSVSSALVIHLGRAERLDIHVRERVAADLVPGRVQGAHLVAIDDAPVRVLRAAGPGRDIERAAETLVFEDGGAVQIGRVGDVVEREAHEWRVVAHAERLGAMMPRCLARNAGQQPLQHGITDRQ
jgi:hypothetical protein